MNFNNKMNHLEEFSNYYIHQINEDEDPIYFQEKKEEENLEEIEDNKIYNKEKPNEGKIKTKESNSKRLRTIPKRYHTYAIDIKKQIIEEVNNSNYYNN